MVHPKGMFGWAPAGCVDHLLLNFAPPLLRLHAKVPRLCGLRGENPPRVDRHGVENHWRLCHRSEGRHPGFSGHGRRPSGESLSLCSRVRRGRPATKRKKKQTFCNDLNPTGRCRKLGNFSPKSKIMGFSLNSCGAVVCGLSLSASVVAVRRAGRADRRGSASY